jgi:hypothetical protein
MNGMAESSHHGHDLKLSQTLIYEKLNNYIMVQIRFGGGELVKEKKIAKYSYLFR